jgi:hypothetical protein
MPATSPPRHIDRAVVFHLERSALSIATTTGEMLAFITCYLNPLAAVSFFNENGVVG